MRPSPPSPRRLINDARREINGIDAIRRWITQEMVGDHVTMEVREVVDHYGETIVRSRYDKTTDYRLNQGDPELFVSLIAEDSEWCGLWSVRHSHLHHDYPESECDVHGDALRRVACAEVLERRIAKTLDGQNRKAEAESEPHRGWFPKQSDAPEEQGHERRDACQRDRELASRDLD
jgi:hypothetical protein